MKAKTSITHFWILDILGAKCSKNEALQRLGKGAVECSLKIFNWAGGDFF
jgi:hypothetical protein